MITLNPCSRTNLCDTAVSAASWLPGPPIVVAKQPLVNSGPFDNVLCNANNVRFGDNVLLGGNDLIAAKGFWHA